LAIVGQAICPEFVFISTVQICGATSPVVALFENLEDGVTVNEFVELFPGVDLLLARSVLEHAAKSVMAVH
jgi:uncharacterized protein (DUF433 family)